MWYRFRRLHSVISGAAAWFGHHPVDVLRGIFDVTSLAVDAVLSVYLQPIANAVLGWHVFINTCQTDKKKTIEKISYYT